MAGTQKQVANKDVERSEPKADDVAHLENLKGLQDRALITEQEYNRQKNEILTGCRFASGVAS